MSVSSGGIRYVAVPSANNALVRSDAGAVKVLLDICYGHG